MNRAATRSRRYSIEAQTHRSHVTLERERNGLTCQVFGFSIEQRLDGACGPISRTGGPAGIAGCKATIG